MPRTLPSLSLILIILQKYSVFNDVTGHPVIREYHFVPLPKLLTFGKAVIFRRRVLREDKSSISFIPSLEFSHPMKRISSKIPDGYVYKNPFTPFPILRSHVHPYFAFRHYVIKGNLPSHLKAHWNYLQKIYRAWVPEEPSLEGEILAPDDHIDRTLDENNMDEDRSEWDENDGPGQTSLDVIHEEDGVDSAEGPRGNGSPHSIADDAAYDFESLASDSDGEEILQEPIYSCNVGRWAKQVATGISDQSKPVPGGNAWLLIGLRLALLQKRVPSFHQSQPIWVFGSLV